MGEPTKEITIALPAEIYDKLERDRKQYHWEKLEDYVITLLRRDADQPPVPAPGES